VLARWRLELPINHDFAEKIVSAINENLFVNTPIILESENMVCCLMEINEEKKIVTFVAGEQRFLNGNVAEAAGRWVRWVLARTDAASSPSRRGAGLAHRLARPV
jgi:hypothetical protein